jgi:hypothetical protein
VSGDLALFQGDMSGTELSIRLVGFAIRVLSRRLGLFCISSKVSGGYILVLGGMSEMTDKQGESITSNHG